MNDTRAEAAGHRAASASPTGADVTPRGGIPMAALAQARGLLRDVLARVMTRGALDVPAPVLASAHRTQVVDDYLVWWITHPDPAGSFAARTRWLRWLPPSLLLFTLFTLGYDGLIYLKDDRVVGHVFFHRRGSAVHGFSTAVSGPFDGSGYSFVLLLDYVACASQMPGVEKARVGRGQNNLTRRFLQRLKTHETSLGWRVDLEGWVTFRAD